MCAHWLLCLLDVSGALIGLNAEREGTNSPVDWRPALSLRPLLDAIQPLAEADRSSFENIMDFLLPEFVSSRMAIQKQNANRAKM